MTNPKAARRTAGSKIFYCHRDAGRVKRLRSRMERRLGRASTAVDVQNQTDDARRAEVAMIDHAAAIRAGVLCPHCGDYE